MSRDGGGPLPPVGRAQRTRCTDGEVWTLPPGAEALAQRLVAWGRRGIGRFVALEDASTAVLRRSFPSTLRAAWGDAPMAVEEAMPWMVSLARALAHCERTALFPGPVTPRSVWVEGPTAGLLAGAAVDVLVGAEPPPEPALGRWTPPEPAVGQRWTAASNRYALGLILYRTLAGVHPFAGRGRRLELADGAQRGAPPMPEAVARTFPPGLQSMVLALLDPDPSARPNIETVVARLDAIARGRADLDVDKAVPGAPAVPSVSAPRRRGRAPWAAVGLLGMVAAGLWMSSVQESAPRPAPMVVRPVAALDSERTEADDCADCHPEHAAQWHGSVMAHSVKSPLFGALEILIEEQAGRDFDCPGGAGVLRKPGAGACVDPTTGVTETGTGGAHWCVNCHAPEENLQAVMPAWDGRSASSQTRRPIVDLLPQSTLEGISCAFCHQVDGPAHGGTAYQGNPAWVSPASGQRFVSRPEDRRGQPGIGNSGYHLDRSIFVGPGDPVTAGAHVRPPADVKAYLASSEFCGACHDVRLFGTDARAVRSTGEHFKRLRNAYSEWVDWADRERDFGRTPASCQDCHMSLYPGVCEPDEEGPSPDPLARTRYTALERACPPGTRFSPRAPGSRPQGRVAVGSSSATRIASHAFSGVDVPLSPLFPAGLVDDAQLDAHGSPRGVTQRRDLLLGATFRFDLGDPRRRGGRLRIPVEIENVGAGHKVPAGFSQEREIWVHLTVRDALGAVLYEVGRIDRDDEDLHDKRFVRVNVDDQVTDRQGRPLGVFGADVVDGPDHPAWTRRGDVFVGRGLINLQNGFQRCVTCIGRLDAEGRCQPGPGQGRHRADRYADGAYDIDTGACGSNLREEDAFLEVYFPVGSLDATRGVLKGPDAIIDERSAVAGQPQRYVYDLDAPPGPLTVEARLMFRAFPPFLIEAFADYEAQQDARGLRPSGPLVTRAMLSRLEAVELARAEVTLP